MDNRWVPPPNGGLRSDRARVTFAYSGSLNRARAWERIFVGSSYCNVSEALYHHLVLNDGDLHSKGKILSTVARRCNGSERIVENRFDRACKTRYVEMIKDSDLDPDQKVFVTPDKRAKGRPIPTDLLLKRWKDWLELSPLVDMYTYSLAMGYETETSPTLPDLGNFQYLDWVAWLGPRYEA